MKSSLSPPPRFQLFSCMRLSRIRAVIETASAPTKFKLRAGTRCNIAEDKSGPFVFLGGDEGEAVFALAGKKKQSALIQSAKSLRVIRKVLFAAGVFDFLSRK